MTALYAKRDHPAQGGFYLRHIDAMTVEGLHAKSDIAAELAHRDIEIAGLRSAAMADSESRAMFIARLENAKKNNEAWLTIDAVLALLNDCDYLASRASTRAEIVECGAPQEQASAMNAGHVKRLADVMATAFAAREIPTGALYRGIADSQYHRSRETLFNAIDALTEMKARP